MTIVIGSGPAGVAAAYALVRQGIAVTMLDVGEQIEPERERLVDKLYGTEDGPTSWNNAIIHDLKGELVASAKGIPLKRVYGSDYPHRDRGQGTQIQAQGTGEVLTSGALGGFSNVWGAQLMPYMARDFAGWPLGEADFAPHYRAVLGFVPISACHDDLEEFLPLYKENPDCLQSSRQASAFLTHLGKNRDALKAQGWHYGRSRVAAQVKPTAANPRGCVYCGMCMHGCPYRLIYTSAYTLAELRRDPHFRYVPGVVVERLNETARGVEIVARRLPDGTAETITAERVYMGCGAVSTTQILLQSLEAYDRETVIHDSVQVMVPVLYDHPTKGVMQESQHTLGQVNVLAFDEKISPRAMHFQFYTYNDHYIAAVKGKLGPLYPLGKPFQHLLFERFSVILAYLHSDDSPAMATRLIKENGKTRFMVEGKPNARTEPTAKALTNKLWKDRKLFGLTPLLPMMEIQKPGKGYHFGASFPMRDKPGDFESDVWGRPTGFRRVHVVDGSVLPSLASTTFTFTVMANAHRIASAHRSHREMD